MSINRQAADGGRSRSGLNWLVGLIAAASCVASATAAPLSAPENAPVSSPAAFARVGDAVISHEQFDAAFVQAARSKFYHGKAPDGAVAALQREVGQALVDEVLLLKEAERRQVQADSAAVQKTLDGYDERYRGNVQWHSNRERLLPGLRAKLERDSVLEQLRQRVQAASEPTAADLQQYWERHKEKFTTPEQVRLSVILLKVDPSSPQSGWQAAQQQAVELVGQLRAGADFGELARAHSKEESASEGGDMGLVHLAMLPEAAQEALAKIQPGEISEATFLLEGVAIFRIESRREARLNPLDAVRERARGLWMRDKAEENWLALLERLRRDTPASVDDSRFLPLATAASTNGEASPR